MQLQTTTETVYAIARGDSLVSASLHGTVESAQQELAVVADRMRSIAIEPDAYVVQATRKVTFSRVKPYEPSDETDTSQEPAGPEAGTVTPNPSAETQESGAPNE